MAGKAQHTVQRFHIAQFAGHDPKGHVWIYDNRSGEPRSAIPANVSIENNFYSFEREDGTWDNLLDDWITKVEGKATPVYVKLLDGKTPPYSQDKYDFAQYLALTYVRTRTMRRMSAETIGQMMQVKHYAHAENSKAFEVGVARYEKDKGKILTPEAKEDLRKSLLDPSGFIMSLPKDLGFAGFHVLDDLTDIFLNTHWSLVDAGSGFYITSDNPLLRMLPGPRPRRDFGFRHKTMEVTFPLSPRRMLLLTYEKPPADRWIASKETVREQNEGRAVSCENELYCHLEHKHVARLSARFKDKRLNRKVFGYGPKEYAPVKVRRRRKREIDALKAE
jgi:Protein of unknown function (DUF4238)